MSDLNKIWECTIFIAEDEIPNGADFPPREAAIRAIESMSLKVTACSSGWGCEEFTPKIAKLKKENQQLKQRIEQLEWELEGIQCVFANENDDPLIDPFNSENLFKWLNRNDIEQQEKGIDAAIDAGIELEHIENHIKPCGDIKRRAIEQLRKGGEL